MTRPSRPQRIVELAHKWAKNERFVAAVHAAMKGFGSFVDIQYRTFDAPPYFPEGMDGPWEFWSIISEVADMITRGEIKDLERLEHKYAQFFQQPDSLTHRG